MNAHRSVKKITCRGRCGHPYCSSCATTRGRNRGNRRARYAARRAIRSGND